MINTTWRLLISASALLLFSVTGLASGRGPSHQQKKPWLSAHYRSVQFPDQRYYMVYQEIPCQKRKYHEESIRELGFQLRDELSRKVILQVVSENESRQSQTSGTDGTRVNSTTRFRSAQKSLTKLTEVKEDFYYDSRRKLTCGIAYVEKKRLADSYYVQLISALEDLRTRVNAFTSNPVQGKIDLESSTRYRQLVDALRLIDTDKTVFMQLATDPGSSVNRSDVQLRFNEINESLQMHASDFTDPFISKLIEEATLAESRKEFRVALQKFDEALIYNPTLQSAADGRRRCVAILTDAAKKELDAFILSENYQGIFKSVGEITELDPSLTEEYTPMLNQYRQKFFESTLRNIDFYLDKGDAVQARYWINALEPYIYINKDAYQKRVADLERLDVKLRLTDIETRIYAKEYIPALSMIASAQAVYPFNDRLANESNRVAYLIYKERKKAFKLHRPTRMLIEGGAGVGTQSTRFLDNSSNAVGINDREYFFDHLLSVYQFGVYRKINVKPKKEPVPGVKTPFKYSQVGLRGVYVNPSAGIYNLQSDSNVVTQPFSFELAAGWVGGRFLSFHLGMISESDSLDSFKPLKPDYFTGSLGFRIPFGFIHLVSEAAFLSDFDSVYRMQLRSGILVSIGANKKYNSRDRGNLKTEISRMKHK